MKRTISKNSKNLPAGSEAQKEEKAEITAIPGKSKTYRVQLKLNAVSGRRRTVTRTVKGLAAARRMARELEGQRDTLRAAIGIKKKRGQGLTLLAAIERYLSAGRVRWTPKTYATKRYRLLSLILPLLGADVPVCTLTPLDVQKLQDALLERLAPISTRCYMLTFCAFCSQLVAWGLIPSTPCAGLVRIKAHGRHKPIWDASQVEKVLSAPDCPLWLRLALVTGARPEEIQALTWAHVDWERGGVYVRQVAYFDTAAHQWKAREGAKTARSVRFIPLDAATMDAMQRERQERGTGESWIIPAPRNGGICGITTLRSRLSSWAAAHDLPVIPLYALRHSSLTYLLDHGASVQVVAARAGHASSTTTLSHYATATDAAAQQAANLFGNVAAGYKG